MHIAQVFFVILGEAMSLRKLLTGLCETHAWKLNNDHMIFP